MYSFHVYSPPDLSVGEGAMWQSHAHFNWPITSAGLYLNMSWFKLKMLSFLFHCDFKCIYIISLFPPLLLSLWCKSCLSLQVSFFCHVELHHEVDFLVSFDCLPFLCWHLLDHKSWQTVRRCKPVIFQTLRLSCILLQSPCVIAFLNMTFVLNMFFLKCWEWSQLELKSETDRERKHML